MIIIQPKTVFVLILAMPRCLSCGLLPVSRCVAIRPKPKNLLAGMKKCSMLPIHQITSSKQNTVELS